MEFIKGNDYSYESIAETADSIGGPHQSTIYRWIRLESETGSYLHDHTRALMQCIVCDEHLDFINQEIVKRIRQ